MSDLGFRMDRHRAERVHGFILCDRVAQVSRRETQLRQLWLTTVTETRLPTEECVYW
jgi:hypothetical protein